MEMVTRDPKATPNLDSQRILSRLGITTSDSSTTSSDSNSEPSPSKSEDSSNAPIEDVVFQDEVSFLFAKKGNVHFSFFRSCRLFLQCFTPTPISSQSKASFFPLLCTTSNNGFSSRSNIAKLAQAPSLWSLLTELTGTQSLHCDRVSQAILSLLLHMRQNPEGS